ncbi:hypothetical protein M8818_000425 [Zalaria obscura]|uniref:Uncharacterized protein n=1 Tax=Zalaria obscura TaxID=2024903 RepID=A0ACC3SN87_9PEZI
MPTLFLLRNTVDHGKMCIARMTIMLGTYPSVVLGATVVVLILGPRPSIILVIPHPGVAITVPCRTLCMPGEDVPQNATGDGVSVYSSLDP